MATLNDKLKDEEWFEALTKKMAKGQTESKMRAEQGWGKSEAVSTSIPLDKKIENGKVVWEGKPVTIEGTYKPEHKNATKAREAREANKDREYEPAPAPKAMREIPPTIVKGNLSKDQPAPNEKMQPERTSPALQAQVEKMDGQSREDINSRSKETREALAKKSAPLSWEEIEAYLNKAKQEEKEGGPDLLAAALISLVPTVVGGMMGGLGGAAAGAKGGASGVNHLIEGNKEKSKNKKEDGIKEMELRHKIHEGEAKRLQEDKKLLFGQVQAEYQALGKVSEPTKRLVADHLKADALARNQAQRQDDQQDHLINDREDKQAGLADQESQRYQGRVMEGNLRSENDRIKQGESHAQQMTRSEKQNNFQTGKMTNEQDHQFNLQNDRQEHEKEMQKLKPKPGAKGAAAKSSGLDKQVAKIGENPIPGYQWNQETFVSSAELNQLRTAVADRTTINRLLDQVKTIVRNTPKAELFTPKISQQLTQKLTQARLKYKGRAFADLGVINGPDEKLIDMVVTDPTGLKSLIQDPKNFVANFDELISNIEQSVNDALYTRGFSPKGVAFAAPGGAAKGGNTSLKHGFKDGETKVIKGWEYARKDGQWIPVKKAE